ncbi:MAG: AAA family ATPase, partial [Pyrobaculum sp.]
MLLLGPPGVGKSATVKQVAKELAKSLGLPFVDTAILTNEEAEKLLQEKDTVFLYTDIRLSYHEPVDLLGVPRSRNGATVFEPPLHILLHTRHPGVLFFDEITAVQRDDLLAVMLQVALDRQVGYQRLHPRTF